MDKKPIIRFRKGSRVSVIWGKEWRPATVLRQLDDYVHVRVDSLIYKPYLNSPYGDKLDFHSYDFTSVRKLGTFMDKLKIIANE